MLEVTLDTSDLRKALENFFTTLRREASEALGDAAQASLERIASGTYWTQRTGKTARSFKARQRGELAYEVSSNAPVAGFLNAGTKPHVIEAKRGRLRFVANGQVRFARRVRHPGTRPIGFEAIEAQKGQADAERGLERAAERAVQSSGVGLAMPLRVFRPLAIVVRIEPTDIRRQWVSWDEVRAMLDRVHDADVLIDGGAPAIRMRRVDRHEVVEIQVAVQNGDSLEHKVQRLHESLLSHGWAVSDIRARAKGHLRAVG